MAPFVLNALGTYGSAKDRQIFTSERFNPRLQHVERKRFVYISEPNGVVDGAILKKYAGNDPFDSELKGMDGEYNIDLMCTFYIMTNEALKIHEADAATLVKLAIIPFDHVLEGDEVDKGAENTYPPLLAKAMLSWMVDGLNKYYANGGKLIEHKALEIARDNYISETSPYGQAVEDFCEIAPKEYHTYVKMQYGGWHTYPAYRDHGAEYLCPARDLMKVFTEWMTNNYGNSEEGRKLSTLRFGKYLATQGVKRLRDETTREYFYCGLKLTNDAKLRMPGRNA